DPIGGIVDDITPDDLHTQGNQWYLTKINSENAWNVSKGSSTTKIAIVDRGVESNHSDLSNKLTGGDSGTSGDHGTQVAGVAGAETDNGLGIASLG
ncbi:MAG: peptidase S8, partial [Gammaproteobacteria bacterium]|nr:peptidase S8 [Gammaproteobacteria bacterium]